MEIPALNVSLFYWCFHRISCDDFSKETVVFCSLNPLEGLASDSILQYHPFRVCRFGKSALF